MSTQKIVIPVRLALEMCGNDVVAPEVWNQFLKMVKSGEIEILPDEEFNAISLPEVPHGN